LLIVHHIKSAYVHIMGIPGFAYLAIILSAATAMRPTRQAFPAIAGAKYRLAYSMLAVLRLVMARRAASPNQDSSKFALSA
jgi:hypothetical protein